MPAQLARLEAELGEEPPVVRRARRELRLLAEAPELDLAPGLVVERRPAERLRRVSPDGAELLPRVEEGRDQAVERPRVQPRPEGERAHVAQLGGDGLDHRPACAPADGW